MFSHIHVTERRSRTNLIGQFFCFKTFGNLIDSEILGIFQRWHHWPGLFRCCSANNLFLRKCLVLPFAFIIFNACIFRFGFSPVMLLFFLTVILQNECCYFFTCCILASYIVLAYLYYTIVCLFSCLLFCFFALYV